MMKPSNAMLTWRAIYNDKTELLQYNADGTENKYRDIDRYKLVRFDLLDGNTPVYSVYLRQGQRLIYRRRYFIKSNNERHMIYLVGWQLTTMSDKGPRNITAINYIYEDGSVALDDSRDNLEMLPEEF